MVATEGIRWRVTSEAEIEVVFSSVFDDVHRYASRLAGSDRSLAEDLVQDAFVGLVRAVRNGDVDEVSIGWLLVSVRNRFHDHVRRERSARRVGRLRAVRDGDASPGPGDTDQALGMASAALASLGAEERLVLVLHHVDGRSVREVAATIGKSVHATESILARARGVARAAVRRERDHD